MGHQNVHHVLQEHILIVVLQVVLNAQKEVIKKVAHLLAIIVQQGNFLQKKVHPNALIVQKELLQIKLAQLNAPLALMEPIHHQIILFVKNAPQGNFLF